jgi:hypothetical protein
VCERSEEEEEKTVGEYGEERSKRKKTGNK